MHYTYTAPGFVNLLSARRVHQDVLDVKRGEGRGRRGGREGFARGLRGRGSKGRGPDKAKPSLLRVVQASARFLIEILN